MVGSCLASLLAHSWVSLDFDLASVSCQELNGKQQLDKKTAEGCGDWRCYSSRKGDCWAGMSY